MEGIKDFIIPAAYVLGGFITGWLVEVLIIVRLKQIVKKTPWKGDDLLISTLPIYTIFWFTLLGIYIASFHIHGFNMSQEREETVRLYFHKVVYTLAILSITFFASRISVGLIRIHSTDTSGAMPSTSIIVNITRIAIFVVGFLIILQTLKISITPLLTALGVGGLAVALAMQETLSSLFAGLHILGSKNIKIGDYVKLSSGEEGYVTDITWRYTTIRALQNNLIIIPNSQMASSIIMNYFGPEKELSVLVDVGVDYKSDLEFVEKVTIETARETLKKVQGGVSEFQPFIRYNKFDDFSINFSVILRAREFVDQYLLKHEFIKMLHARYKKEGINIPFPIRTIIHEPPEESK